MTTQIGGIWAVLSVLAAGCASPYTSHGPLGGFSETQEAPDRFRIHFVSIGRTSWERTHDFTLLHAAELTLQHSFQCFEILHGTDFASVSTAMSLHGGCPTTIFGPTQRLHSEILIRCFKEQPAEGRILDAEFFVQSIRAKYQMS
jgi:hypothetical protein